MVEIIVILAIASGFAFAIYSILKDKSSKPKSTGSGGTSGGGTSSSGETQNDEIVGGQEHLKQFEEQQ